MEKQMKIRLAELEDAHEILDIYRPYVEQTTVTFEYDPPTLPEFKARMSGILGEFPYLVLHRDGEILGYAYAARQRERAAYRWNAELSIYLRRDAQRSGAGTALYGALLELLRMQGIVNVYGVITHPNEPSENFHRKMGFSLCGIWHRTGWKFGGWLDVCEMERRIAAPAGEPKPVIPFSRLSPESVDAVFARANNELEERGAT